jgi:integrase
LPDCSTTTASVPWTSGSDCKKGLIFADPAARIRSTPRPETMILPLPAERISSATGAAVTPAARLTLALAAVHALRPEAIRHLALGDIDLQNRRITIGGQSRPLDDLTRKLITEWLAWRRKRWPVSSGSDPACGTSPWTPLPGSRRTTPARSGRSCG